MARKREVEIFSMSFLDCICCGFGAIILLFILTMGVSRTIVKKSRQELEHTLQEMLASFGVLQTEHVRLSGELASKEKSLQDIITEVAELQALLARLNEQIQNENSGKKSLLTEVQDLKREVAVMQKEVPDIPQVDTSKPIGVPVESNYVAFVIDTSGSMRDESTNLLLPYVVRKFDEVIGSYPEVKGVQFLDADGRFILGRGDGWIPDSKETREAVINAVRRYGIYSNSNPVPGIVRAIRTLHDPNNTEMKMGIYVFGDEFTETAEMVLERVDRLNPKGANGKRPITINGIGFPNLMRSGFSLGQTGVKFANLMRELTQENGGAFVAVIGSQQ
jgi:hypothetical protein